MTLEKFLNMLLEFFVAFFKLLIDLIVKLWHLIVKETASGPLSSMTILIVVMLLMAIFLTIKENKS